jgi:hypothetical protein
VFCSAAQAHRYDNTLRRWFAISTSLNSTPSETPRHAWLFAALGRPPAFVCKRDRAASGRKWV